MNKNTDTQNVQPDGELFINRELSWLEFNRRVLDLSRDKNVPLAEQLKFAAIYASNLDEFFMIRVGSLYDQTLLKNESKENKTGMTPQEQLTAVMPKVEELQRLCGKSVEALFQRLKRAGLAKVDFQSLDGARQDFWKKLFQRDFSPVLSPQIIDRRHPFPFLRNMDIYVGALLRERKGGQPVFGLIPVSAQFGRMVTVNEDGGQSFALVEELILNFAELAFGKSSVLAKCLFRITRNADINVEEGMFDHDIDYRVVMSELLKKRRKLAAVRLQLSPKAPDAIRDYLLARLMLPAEQCFVQNAPLELSFFHSLHGRLQKTGDASLFYPQVKPIAPPPGYSLYEEIRRRDLMVYYPYQSMRPFIEMLYHAGRDPAVISIKMTLYRVASESKVIEALIAAAENGKEVVTIVELRARFDEQQNIEWSRQLEQAGCTVIYGFQDYKVHSKLLLITRRGEDRFEYITQIGTGNYNEKTSELYTDLAYFSADAALGEEAAAVFNNLAVERLTQWNRRLIVAPLKFKTVLLDEIREEMAFYKGGGDAAVAVKCNSISDKTVIETLSEASAAGVPVRMLVRGICCLQAGLSGLSENIEVHSLVGRYLEHARIYAFGKKERLRVYIASGDFLTRNTERRVEVGVKIEDEAIKRLLLEIFEAGWADKVNASRMEAGGRYTKLAPEKDEKPLDSQFAMYGIMENYLKAVHGAPPPQAESAPPAAEAAPLRPAARRKGRLARLWRLLRRAKNLYS